MPFKKIQLEISGLLCSIQIVNDPLIVANLLLKKYIGMYTGSIDLLTYEPSIDI